MSHTDMQKALGAAQRRAGKAEAERDEWKDTATTLRGLLDNHAHNDQAMNDALLAVTAERDEARAALDRVRALCDEADHSGRHVNGYGYVLLRPLRAALDGEGR